MKSKYIAALLAFFLGNVGIHKFYTNKGGTGLVYILFCWTFVPMIISFFEGIIYLTMSDDKFNKMCGDVDSFSQTINISN